MACEHPVPTGGPARLPRHLSDEWLFADPLAIAGEPEPEHDPSPVSRRRHGRRRRSLALAARLLLLAATLVAAWWHAAALRDSRMIPDERHSVTTMTPEKTCARSRNPDLNP